MPTNLRQSRLRYLLLILWLVSYGVLLLLTLPRHAAIYGSDATALDAQVVRDFCFILLFAITLILYLGLRCARQRGSMAARAVLLIFMLLAQAVAVAVLLVASNVVSGFGGAIAQEGAGSAFTHWLGLPPLTYSTALLLAWLGPNLLLLAASFYAFLRPDSQPATPTSEGLDEPALRFVEDRRPLLLYWLLLGPAVIYGASGLLWVSETYGLGALNLADWFVYGGSILFPILWLLLLRGWQAFMPPLSYALTAEELTVQRGGRVQGTITWAEVREAEDYQPSAAARRTLTLADETHTLEIADDYFAAPTYDRLADEIASRTPHADWRADFKAGAS